jgi:hypothetical protein
MFRTCCTGLFTERSKTGALDEITEDSSSPLTSGSNSSALKSGRDAVGGGREQRKETKKPTQAVFLEIVGALYLNFVKEDMDPFCIVKVGNKEVHRTKVIPNDTSPIWTSKTKACCLLHLELAQGVIIQLCHTHAPLGAANVPLGAALVGATKVVGEVHLRYSKLIQGKAQREEYHLLDNLPVTLAIKFRPATREDSLFFQKIPTHVVPSAGHAQDIEFKHGRSWQETNGISCLALSRSGSSRRNHFFNQTTIVARSKKTVDPMGRRWLRGIWDGAFGNFGL